MWLPIILLCASPYIESCKIITGLKLYGTREECFREVNSTAKAMVRDPAIYKVKPACQIVPEKIKEPQEKKIDI